MVLFSRKNLSKNPYGLTKDDLKGDIKDFPMGVVVRMIEEQELQGNRPDVKRFCVDYQVGKVRGGFDWAETEAGKHFWSRVVINKNWRVFYERYPEYARYNLA